LGLNIFVCDLQPSLEPTQFRIHTAHIPQKNYEHISTILLGGCRICVSRLDTATDSAENIQLPGRCNAALEITELDGDYRRGSLRPWCNHHLAIPSRRGRRVDGGKIARPRDAPDCTSFLYAFESQFEI
jgi:hypothetical protein